jgi:hypothetical protein
MVVVEVHAWLERLATQICRSMVQRFDQSNVVLAAEPYSQARSWRSYRAERS